MSVNFQYGTMLLLFLSSLKKLFFKTFNKYYTEKKGVEIASKFHKQLQRNGKVKLHRKTD